MKCTTEGCHREARRGGGACGACRMRACRARHPMRAKFQALQRSAQKRRIAFLLTFEQFETWAREVHYVDLVGVRGFHCDRMRAEGGYEMGNIRLLHYTENCSKGSHLERGLRGSSEAAS